ncbi:MAG: hypothetical protein QMD92_00360 [bacterium]|nr:hypothetical protein [bacterium]
MANLLKKYKHSLPLRGWILILITVLGVSVSLPLLRSGYFSHQDDLQVMRIFEMRKCFSDFQIPCRWVPDMGWGNGFPLFNFYGVSTYYLGAIISFFVGFLNASKILFFISLTAGSYGVYALVRDLWGKYAGLTSAVLYLFVPYKALDVYVRGALSESMALALIPFVLYFGYKKSYKLFVLTLFLFLITHNIMTIIFLPIILLWMIYWNDLRIVIITFVITLGLSSFFILPAFFEKSLVQTESLTRFELDFRANFISIKQLFFNRVWGYGTSIPGPEGRMNFQIGWPHWILTALSLVIVLFRKKEKHMLLVTCCLLLFIFSIFMTHNKSSFIWENINILEYFQFPWRFLSLSVLTSSILGGFVVLVVKEKFQKYLCALIIITTVILNWNYFKPKEYYKITDKQKLSGELWEQQRKGALLDYLPKTALEPREGANTTLTNFVSHSNKFSFEINLDKETQIEVPVFYFPNWEATVNGKVYPLTHDNILGRISILLPEGNHKVVGKFKNTALRTFANTITLISVIGFILICRKKYI